MADEIALHRATTKAARAQELLANETLKQAYDDREADLIAAWIATALNDVEGRESLYRHLHANRKLRDYLQSYVSDGKLAAAELTRNAELAARKPRWQDI